MQMNTQQINQTISSSSLPRPDGGGVCAADGGGLPQTLLPRASGGGGCEADGGGLSTPLPSSSSPNPKSLIPNPPPLSAALTRDLLDGSLSPLDLCDYHNLTLNDLVALINSDDFKYLKSSIEEINAARQSVIESESRTAALAALTNLANRPIESQQGAETSRKAATKLEQITRPKSKPPKAKPHHRSPPHHRHLIFHSESCRDEIGSDYPYQQHLPTPPKHPPTTSVNFPISPQFRGEHLHKPCYPRTKIWVELDQMFTNHFGGYDLERSKMKTNQIIALAIAAAAGVASADSVYFQGFDAQGVGYTTSTDGLGGSGIEFSDGGLDFFTHSDATVSSTINYNGANGGYFAAMDTNGSPGPSALPLYLTTDTFSIAGFSNLGFAVDLAEDLAGNGANDWDLSDFVNFEYQVDGGTWTNIFSVINDGVTMFNTLAFVNGVAVSDTFSTFSADLSGVTGSTMALRVVWSLDSGDEDLAIDGLSIIGESIAVVPLPTAAIAGLGMLGLMGATRRFRK